MESADAEDTSSVLRIAEVTDKKRFKRNEAVDIRDVFGRLRRLEASEAKAMEYIDYEFSEPTILGRPAGMDKSYRKS